MQSLRLLFCSGTVALVACSTPTREQWRMVYREDFERPATYLTSWAPEIYGDTDRFSDDGAYFKEKNPNFRPPKKAFRAESRFGQDGWLEIRSYSRSTSAAHDQLASIVSDPANPGNHVLKIHSPQHTDATVLRSTRPLPARYRVCARVGYPSFGSDRSEALNGYLGSERAEPWLDSPSIFENGFYWMAVLDTEPKPHNNVFIHHHRKVVIDSDNNDYPADQGGPWSFVWNGKSFIKSGKHIVMMFALDRSHQDDVFNYDRTGQPFISYAAGQWNEEATVKQIRAVDAYIDREWYKVCISRLPKSYTLSIEGNFKYGGHIKYESRISRDKVFHAEESFPDFFMIGDPHINFYRGDVYVDDVTLEVPTNP